MPSTWRLYSTLSTWRLSIRGEFLSRTKPHEATISPVALPPVGSPVRMLYIWLTTYIANTAGIVYEEAGELKTQITPDEVPSSIPIKLNTNSFKALIPGLYNKYPGMNMTLFLNATTPPVLTVDPKGANVTVFMWMCVCMIVRTGTRSHLRSI